MANRLTIAGMDVNLYIRGEALGDIDRDLPLTIGNSPRGLEARQGPVNDLRTRSHRHTWTFRNCNATNVNSVLVYPLVVIAFKNESPPNYRTTLNIRAS